MLKAGRFLFRHQNEKNSANRKSQTPKIDLQIWPYTVVLPTVVFIHGIERYGSISSTFIWGARFSTVALRPRSAVDTVVLMAKDLSINILRYQRLRGSDDSLELL